MGNETPKVDWNGTRFEIVLPIEENIIEARITPEVTYIVRIRECEGGEWSAGFETPFTHCNFVDLKPNTEYEFEIAAKNRAGKGPSTYARAKTDSDGNQTNVIEFPRSR